MNFTRRHFLETAASAVLLAGCTARAPIKGSMQGPSPERGHRLRSGDFPVSSETERHTIVIIGGGIAGLAAARKLRQLGHHDLLLLELEDHTGGNSSSGRNSVSAYPWGAHYVTLPSSDAGEVIQLYEELGLITGRNTEGQPIYDELALVADPAERLFLHGRWQEGLIPQIGASDADHREYAAFAACIAEFKAARGKDGRRAFTIPVDRSSSDETFTQLDQLTMRQWLDARGWHSEKLRWQIDYACRDDFGGCINQVSAWAAIHYFAGRDGVAANAEDDVFLTWPEGNGWLENQLRAPVAGKVRTGWIAWNIEPIEDNVPGGGGVRIDAFDFQRQKSVRLEARAAIVCTPRFITQRIVAPLRGRPAPSLEYGPWVSANLTLDHLPAGAGFGPAWENVFYDSRSLGYVIATHQSLAPATGPSVITWYKALCEGPAASERGKAYARSHAEWCELALADLRRVHPEIDSLVRNIDVCVWGHGMIRPTPGLIWGQARTEMAQPLGSIHFAHSDLSGISLFEEAYTRGVLAAEALSKQMPPA